MQISFTFQRSTGHAAQKSMLELYSSMQSKFSTKTRGWKGVVAMVQGNNIVIWDINTRRELNVFQHSSRPNYIIQLRNGTLAASNTNKKIYIYDIDLGTRVRKLVGHTESTFSLLELQNGNLLSECSGGTIRLWDMNNGTCLRTMQNVGKIATMCQLHDGTVIISDENAIAVWNIDTGEKIKTVHTNAYAHYSITEISKGVIASCSDEPNISMYNVANEITLIGSMPIDVSDVSYTSIRLTNGNFVTTTYEELYLWNQQDGRLAKISCKCNETGVEFMNKMAEVEPGVVLFQSAKNLVYWNTNTNSQREIPLEEDNTLTLRCFIYKL